MISKAVKRSMEAILGTPEKLLSARDRERKPIIKFNQACRPLCWNCDRRVGYYDAVPSNFTLDMQFIEFTCPYCHVDLVHEVSQDGSGWRWGVPLDLRFKYDAQGGKA